jgi:hypothetical protein
MKECPICYSNNYHIFSDAAHLEPDEEWCEDCGFNFQENSNHRSPTDEDYKEHRDIIFQNLDGLSTICNRIKKRESESLLRDIDEYLSDEPDPKDGGSIDCQNLRIRIRQTLGVITP